MFMVSCLDDPNIYEINVYKFFSSYALFAEIRSLGMEITRTNGQTKYQNLKDNKALKRKSRSFYS